MVTRKAINGEAQQPKADEVTFDEYDAVMQGIAGEETRQRVVAAALDTRTFLGTHLHKIRNGPLGRALRAAESKTKRDPQ